MDNVLAAQTAPHPIKVSHARLVAVLGALSALGPFSIDMYLPAFPQIGREFNVPIGSVEMTISIFVAGLALGQPLHGLLSDRYGRRRLLLLGTAVYTAAALGCAYAGSIGALLVWRLVMAIGGAAGQTISRAIVRDWFEERESARYFSILLTIIGASPILAPLAGGQLLTIGGWRSIFVVLTVFGAACFLAVAFGLPESLPAHRRSTGNLAPVLRTYGKLLRNRGFLCGAAALGFLSGALFAYIAGSSAVFIIGYGVSPQHFGLFFGANGIALVLASQVNRRLLRHYAPLRILTLSYACVAVLTAVLAVLSISSIGGLWSVAAVLWGCIALFGFIFPNLAATILGPLGHVAGSASGLLGMAQFGLGSAGGAMVGLLPVSPAQAMAFSMAAFAVAGFVLLWLGSSQRLARD